MTALWRWLRRIFFPRLDGYEYISADALWHIWQRERLEEQDRGGLR